MIRFVNRATGSGASPRVTMLATGQQGSLASSKDQPQRMGLAGSPRRIVASTLYNPEATAGHLRKPSREKGTVSSNRTVQVQGDLVDAIAVGNRADGGRHHDHAVTRWAEIAASRATVRGSDDPPGLIATVVGIKGPWGFGATRGEALEELKSVLVDWVYLKLEDGDDDIPIMEGVQLAIAG